jgi:hypothetical protein
MAVATWRLCMTGCAGTMAMMKAEHFRKTGLS